jgi:hypothetical protein
LFVVVSPHSLSRSLCQVLDHTRFWIIVPRNLI